jgi:hypothetical protein
MLSAAERKVNTILGFFVENPSAVYSMVERNFAAKQRESSQAMRMAFDRNAWRPDGMHRCENVCKTSFLNYKSARQPNCVTIFAGCLFLLSFETVLYRSARRIIRLDHCC